MMAHRPAYDGPVTFQLRAQRFAVHRAPVPHLVIDDVFGADASRAMLDHLVALEPAFVPAAVGGRAERADFRANLVFGPDAHFHDPAEDTFEATIAGRAARSPLLAGVDALLLSRELRELMESAPAPLHALARANRWETQVSRYGAGDRYGWHLDRLGDDARQVSIVYYLFEEPARFEGGRLELSDGLARGGRLLCGERREVEPRHDRAVIFSSRAVHRVTETELSSLAFGDGRFSVNVFCGVG